MQKITFINPEIPHPNFVSYALFPEYGTHLLATITKKAGYDVQLFVERIGAIGWDRILESDAVCVHTFSATVPKLIEYSHRIRAARPDLPIIVGGTHASIMIEDTLQYCDVVVRQEGDETLLDVLSSYRDGKSLRSVLGIAYWENGKVRINPARPFVQVPDVIPDLDLIPEYLDWSVLKRLRLRRNHLQLLQTSRGCPYKCSFCVAPRELGNEYRLRDIESVIADIKYQMEYSRSRRFFIVDNHFTLNPHRTKAILRRIIAEKLDWSATCFSRIEVANDDELLALLKKAGVEILYIGLESFDDRVLTALNKKQTGEAVRRGLKRIREAGLRPLGSFVVGTDDETVETIRLTIDAAIAEDLEYLVLFPLGGFPEQNSPTVPLNRFLVDTWDRMDATHVTYLPKNLRPSTLQREINRAYRRFYGARQIWRRLRKKDWESGVQRIVFSYLAGRIRQGTEDWAKHLETIEGRYYDQNDRLVESSLGDGVHPARYPGRNRVEIDTSAAFMLGAAAP